MPPKSSWITHIPEIIEQLSSLATPVVDRAVCERTFGVKRRRACALMQKFGGYRSGNVVLLDRIGLISTLERMAVNPETTQEIHRKGRLAERLNQLHRFRAAASVKLPVSAEAWEQRPMTLPADINLEPGLLSVRFDRAEELFARLFQLAQAAANDFEGLRTLAEGTCPSSEMPR